MYSYVANNITYYSSKFLIKPYECYYEFYQENDLYKVYLTNYGDETSTEYIFTNKSLKIAKKRLRDKLSKVLHSGKAGELIRQDYKIFFKIPNLLKDCFSGVGYHITEISNKKGILKNGIIPNFVPDEAVCNASKIIDDNRPKKIPDYFLRKNCVYLHPELENECFAPFEAYYKNIALFAVDLNPYIERSIIGSLGLGGFCLYENDDVINMSELTQYAKIYWRNSRKLQDYILNPPKNPTYDLSEILVPQTISNDHICYLGFWDENSRFHSTNLFSSFIKEQYKENYQEILSLYDY